jgi:hypothetical protein
LPQKVGRRELEHERFGREVVARIAECGSDTFSAFTDRRRGKPKNLDPRWPVLDEHGNIDSVGVDSQ